MKPSKRNLANRAAKQAKLKGGTPRVSRYAAKYGKPPDPPQRPRGAGG